MEIFRPRRMYCEKGDAMAEIMASEKHGYATDVCPTCYFYTNMELDVHSEGTSIERGQAVARLGQTIEDRPNGFTVTDCTPLSEEVARDIDPIIVKQLSASFKQLPDLLFGSDGDHLLES